MIKSGLIFFTTLLGLFLATAGFCAPSVHTKGDPKSVLGFWYTQDHDGGIELYSCGGEVCGRFYWIKDTGPSDVSRDEHNPDPTLRRRSLCHVQFMGGFTPDGEGRYKEGWIYSPRHGATFSAEMTLVDANTLDLHGYIILPALGESQIWKRAVKLPDCLVDEDADQATISQQTAEVPPQP